MARNDVGRPVKKKKYLSLKSKIRRSMFTNTGLTVLLFTATLLGLISFMLSSFGHFVAYTQTVELAEYLGSQDFLDYAEIANLKQLIRPKYDRSWLPVIFESNDAIVLFKPEEMVQDPRAKKLLSDEDLPNFEKAGNLTALQFQFRLGENIVYTTREFHQTTDVKIMDTYVSIPFVSVTGEACVLEGRVTPNLIEFAYVLISVLVIIMAVVGMLISMATAALFTRNIVRPLRSLIVKMNQIAAEDLIDVVQSEISVNKPVQEIVELTDASNAIFLKMREFANLLEAQNQELLAQNDELEASTEQLGELNAEINLFNIRLSSILNHSGQGFLAFGNDLLIQSVYSKECQSIFHCEVEGRLFSDLIYTDAQERTFLNRLYKKVLDVTLDPELYLTLLPTECIKDERFYQVEHKIIPSEVDGRTIMIILTDMTDRKNVEEVIRKEQTNLRRVVKVVRFTQEFRSLYDDMKVYDFENLMKAKQDSHLTREAFYEIFRHLHNFKGLLSQFDFIQSVAHIDAYESVCTALLSQPVFSEVSAAQAVKTMDLMGSLKEDLAIITLYLGDELYSKSQKLQIDEVKISALENHLMANLPPELLAVIMPYVQELRDRRLSQLFRSLPEYALKLADRLEKVIAPFKITGEEIYCEVSHYLGLSKSMIHMVRNALDHGIETVDERLEQDKLEFGTLELDISLVENNQLCLVFKDDGAGIDVESLRQQIVELGLVDEEAVMDWSEEDVLHTIFRDSVTTKDEANDLSGRGIGLSAVRHEVEALGGTLSVETELGRGTQFKILIPFRQDEFGVALDLNVFEGALANTTKNLLEQYTKKCLEACPSVGEERVELYQYSALINTKGLLNTLIVLSLSEEMVSLAGKGYLNCDEPLTTEEREDLVLELANIILGNSLDSLGVLNEQIRLGTPTLVCYNGATVKYSESNIKMMKWSQGAYAAHLSVLYF